MTTLIFQVDSVPHADLQLIKVLCSAHLAGNMASLTCTRQRQGNICMQRVAAGDSRQKGSDGNLKMRTQMAMAAMTAMAARLHRWPWP